tara:strand:- start:15108 stop:15551 length:444 start_codon:yes stop_codon:yes gene_type:complete
MQEKKKLEELEKEGNFIFHGSGLVVEEFEPRQAHNYVDGKNIPDDKPAIFASPFADYAIFMALINKVNCPEGFRASSGFENGTLTFRATQDTLNQLSDESKGYVYVFEKKNFKERSGSEWLSYKSQKPVMTISVVRSDFSQPIDIIK